MNTYTEIRELAKTLSLSNLFNNTQKALAPGVNTGNEEFLLSLLRGRLHSAKKKTRNAALNRHACPLLKHWKPLTLTFKPV